MYSLQLFEASGFFGRGKKAQGKAPTRTHMTNYLKNLTVGENWQSFY
jgi:hypothetical protein